MGHYTTCHRSPFLISMKHTFDTVLLVDDDEITNFINEEVLQKIDIASHIHSLQDGTEALEYIHRHWMNENIPLKKLLLLDINMSHMNGFELLENLPPVADLTIIILTTSQHRRDKELAEKYQVLAYVEKPLTQQKLAHLFSTGSNNPSREL